VDAVRLRPVWSLQILRSIGVPVWSLLIAWQGLYENGRQRLNVERDDQNQDQHDHYFCIVFLLENWASASVDNKSLDELRLSANSENLFDRIRTWKHDLEHLRLTHLLESLEKIEDLIKRALFGLR
jgi:hypothetical protein